MRCVAFHHGAILTAAKVRVSVVGLMIAGFETTAAALAALVLVVGQHVDVQDK